MAPRKFKYAADPAPDPAPVPAEPNAHDEAVMLVQAAEHAIEPAVEAVVEQVVKLVRMVRDHEVYPAPHTADVHPDEVRHWAEHGWARA